MSCSIRIYFITKIWVSKNGLFPAFSEYLSWLKYLLFVSKGGWKKFWDWENEY